MLLLILKLYIEELCQFHHANFMLIFKKQKQKPEVSIKE